MDGEYYEKDGKQYDRVTRVLGWFEPPDLTAWKIRTKDHKKIGKKAMAIGSRVDGMCEADWRGEGYKVTIKDAEEVKNCMRAWEEWKRDYSEVYEDIQAMQETVYYDDWMVAGSLDIRTSQGIIDIKTSGRVSKSYWIQTAVYNRQFQLPKRMVLRLDKRCGTYEFAECPEQYSQEYLENLFLGRLLNYRYEKEET